MMTLKKQFKQGLTALAFSLPLSMAATGLSNAQTAAQPAAPAAAPTVEVMARNCFLCHGAQGKSVTVMPTLAGQTKDYISSHMLDYKSGKLAGTIMPRIAKGYTDEQIAQLAAYFSAQKK